MWKRRVLIHVAPVLRCSCWSEENQILHFILVLHLSISFVFYMMYFACNVAACCKEWEKMYFHIVPQIVDAKFLAQNLSVEKRAINFHGRCMIFTLMWYQVTSELSFRPELEKTRIAIKSGPHFKTGFILWYFFFQSFQPNKRKTMRLF